MVCRLSTMPGTYRRREVHECRDPLLELLNMDCLESTRSRGHTASHTLEDPSDCTDGYSKAPGDEKERNSRPRLAVQTPSSRLAASNASGAAAKVSDLEGHETVDGGVHLRLPLPWPQDRKDSNCFDLRGPASCSRFPRCSRSIFVQAPLEVWRRARKAEAESGHRDSTTRKEQTTSILSERAGEILQCRDGVEGSFAG